jgi:hypothetical protein
MSLFDEGTVIIVGAGASVPFGLPTGGELIDLIVKAFRDEARILDGKEAYFQRYYANIAPISYALWCSDDFKRKISPSDAAEQLKKVANWLDQQTGDSIDDIIRHNPNRAMELKVGICHVLFRKSFDEDREKSVYVIKPFADRIRFLDVFTSVAADKIEKPKPQRNWIHHLINLARGEILDPKITNECKKIRIISFNYDGILEHVLEEKWDNVYSKFGHCDPAP